MPRGLEFGPDGALYVAEAGLGGQNDACLPVVPVVGPYHGGPTARISKITAPGQVSTVADGLPSGQSSLPSGDTLGVADVAFFGNHFYAQLAGAKRNQTMMFCSLLQAAIRMVTGMKLQVREHYPIVELVYLNGQ